MIQVIQKDITVTLNQYFSCIPADFNAATLQLPYCAFVVYLDVLNTLTMSFSASPSGVTTIDGKAEEVVVVSVHCLVLVTQDRVL